MALFTDGISTIQDLMSQDSSVLSTAQTENIDLSQKLAIAQNELGIELTTLLQRSNTYDWQFWLQPDPQLNNIVVTPPLQLWHVFQTLMLVYQDAYFNQLNDRYKGKRDQFQQMAKWAMDKLIQTGIGIAADPIPQAAPPVLTSIPGGQSAMTYYASVSWLDAEGEEGQASNSSTLTLEAGNTLVAQPINQPANAAGWNVYVGLSPTAMALQNTSPLTVDQIWVQAG
ncbi:MAG TPA: hypothetical protein VMG35_28470, partial [Bryobacteraceae bacterium]|nr:hypothetical protein [Bryobacteraceae bacterium]